MISKHTRQKRATPQLASLLFSAGALDGAFSRTSHTPCCFLCVAFVPYLTCFFFNSFLKSKVVKVLKGFSVLKVKARCPPGAFLSVGPKIAKEKQLLRLGRAGRAGLRALQPLSWAIPRALRKLRSSPPCPRTQQSLFFRWPGDPKPYTVRHALIQQAAATRGVRLVGDRAWGGPTLESLRARAPRAAWALAVQGAPAPDDKMALLNFGARSASSLLSLSPLSCKGVHILTIRRQIILFGFKRRVKTRH